MCFTLFFHSLVGVDDLTEEMTWKAKYVRCYVYTQSERTRWAWDEKASLLCIFTGPCDHELHHLSWNM